MKSRGFEPAVRKAWGGHSPNGGRFLLAAGGQYCSVKARVADEAIVRRRYGWPKPAAAVCAPSRAAVAHRCPLFAQPAGLCVEQLEGSTNEWMLTATTSSASEAPMQAALNMYVVPREITRAISN